MAKNKEEKEKIKLGRPETVTPEMADRIMSFFKMGLNDEEVCEQVGIAPSVLYAYQSRHADFQEKKKLAKTNLVARARRELFAGLQSKDEKIRVDTAKWVLERRCKGEFSTRQEITGEDGESLTPVIQILPVEVDKKEEIEN